MHATRRQAVDFIQVEQFLEKFDTDSPLLHEVQSHSRLIYRYVESNNTDPACDLDSRETRELAEEEKPSTGKQPDH